MTGQEALDDPLIGTKIGPCRVEQRLAAGGMGVVYRAHHLLLNQEVALKILAPSLAADQEYVTRFFREAGAAGQIDHPNVIRVIDVGKNEDIYYLIMEYVPGDTLDRILDQERRLSLERATRFTREIAAGLAAAHRSGIVHRDIKPGNIIVSPDGKTHLTDFGLARHAETRKGLTVEGTFLGTPEYASPEQVEGRRLDHRSDLYSLGVTYYQLLSGTLPFLGESPMEMAIKRTKEAARPLENAFPGADPRASAIAMKLLQTEPGQRYQTATDLIRDLDAILKVPTDSRSLPAARKVENVLVANKSRRHLRTLVHEGLLGLACILGFLSGGLAARGAGVLDSWLRSDPDASFRFGLAGTALVLGLISVLAYFREIPTAGRRLALGGLMLAMVAGSLLAGAMIERADGADRAALARSVGRAAIDSLFEPVNRLALGLVALLAAVQVSFEREPGSHRVLACRLLMLLGFPLIYAFGVGHQSLAAPTRSLMAEPELSIPLATATLLACFFGALLVTGYGFERRAKICGTLLTLAGCAGLFTFAVLVSQPQRPEAWTQLLAERFSGMGHACRTSGTLLAAVLAIGVIERGVASAAMRAKDRIPRKRF